MQSDIVVTSARDLSGTIIGRFAIQELLGKGGMGEVYRANDLRLKRQVALKRIAPHLRGDKRSRERLWKEAEWASRLSDPHIAAVHDVIDEENELFIVMEYVEGQTLRRRLAEPISIIEFLPIATECALALAAAHNAGVVHHDIKPENIMLTTSGQVKVLDFGVAKNLPSQPESSTLSTQTCTKLAGTLNYMAPEAVREEESDSRADIFSLGIVFYEAIAGSNPFRAKSFLETSDRILHHDQVPLCELNPKLPAELDRIVGKMLAKDRAQRYSAAADLAVDLRALERTLTESGVRVIRQLPVARRRWAMPWGTLILAAASLVAIAAYTPLDSSSRFGWVLVQYPVQNKSPYCRSALQMATHKLQRSGPALLRPLPPSSRNSPAILRCKLYPPLRSAASMSARWTTRVRSSAQI